MRKALKIALIIVSVIAFITLAGVLLYRFFIGSRIQDEGRMENPDAYRAGKDLVEFEWRQNHRNYYSSFSLKFYQENDMPLLTGWFPSQSGGDEIRESQTDAFSNPIPWQLTWVQWFELQNVLAESELPAYRKPSSDSYDEVDSEIRIVWRTDDGDEAQTHSGSHAEALEALVLGIAEEAYAASKLETEQREVRETAELVGIYWEQTASSARDCFSFLLDERTLPSRAEKQMLFSYRYQDGDGKPIFRQDIAVEPEKAQAVRTFVTALTTSIFRTVRITPSRSYRQPLMCAGTPISWMMAVTIISSCCSGKSQRGPAAWRICSSTEVSSAGLGRNA